MARSNLAFSRLLDSLYDQYNTVLPNDTLPDLDSLRCFAAAARTLNFRAAAQSLHLSPPAFGQRVAQLERDLGAALFERTTRTVRLTAAGERAVETAHRLLALAADLRFTVHNETGPSPFALTIATRFELGISWLTPALARLATLRPHRTLHLSFGDSPAMLSRTTRGLVDAAITSAHTLPTDTLFESLHPEQYVFVGCPDNSNRRWRITAKRAAQLVLLDIDPELPLLNYFARSQQGDSSWRFAEMEYLGTISAIRLRALAGAGVAVLPRYFVADDLRDKRLVDISPHTELLEDAFRLIWRRDHPRSRELAELAADLRTIPLR